MLVLFVFACRVQRSETFAESEESKGGGEEGEVLSFCISIIYLTCHPVLGSINIVNNTVNTPQHVAQTA